MVSWVAGIGDRVRGFDVVVESMIDDEGGMFVSGMCIGFLARQRRPCRLVLMKEARFVGRVRRHASLGFFMILHRSQYNAETKWIAFELINICIRKLLMVICVSKVTSSTGNLGFKLLFPSSFRNSHKMFYHKLNLKETVTSSLEANGFNPFK